jgi:hypothetical protein
MCKWFKNLAWLRPEQRTWLKQRNENEAVKVIIVKELVKETLACSEIVESDIL